LTRYLSFETATISPEEQLNKYILNADGTRNEEMWESTDAASTTTTTAGNSTMLLDLLISANHLSIGDCY